MSELRTRVEAKKKQLEADLLAKKADAQGAASDAVRSIKSRLGELDKLLKDGWDEMSDAVRQKVSEWLR